MLSLIEDLEEKLRMAMISSDVTVLDKLIDDELVFVGPDGSVATKQMDLEAHKSKIQRISSIEASEQNVFKRNDELYIVTVKIAIKGYFGDLNIDGTYRYLRIWKKVGDSFKIISGSVVKINL